MDLGPVSSQPKPAFILAGLSSQENNESSGLGLSLILCLSETAVEMPRDSPRAKIMGQDPCKKAKTSQTME